MTGKDREPRGDPSDSAFHRGEQAIQTRLGIRDKMEKVGRRLLRPNLIEEHREFFQRLPMLFIASIDAHGHPVVSLRWGEPGFLSSPDPRHLIVRGQMPNGDPVQSQLKVGSPVGLLGLIFENRRRNRLNGTVEAMDENGGFTLGVEQSFGNCPKYIQQRRWQWRLAPGSNHDRELVVHEDIRLSAQLIEFLSKADTFFIATSAAGEPNGFTSDCQTAALGVDVSHRGGTPGFIRVIDDRTLEFPDYSGNMFFNTLGNLVVDDRAALLFPDFESGDLIQCQGHVEILWESDELTCFPGAQRVLRVRVSHVRHAIGVLPFSWSPPEPSPVNP